LRLLLTLAVLLQATIIYSQDLTIADTTIVNGDTTVLRSLGAQGPITEIEMQAPDHSPARATLLSATIPGLGQAYNKKYWKIPIVWGGLGAFGYFISWNNERYQYYRKNLIYEIEGDPDYPNETVLDQAALRSARDFYRRSRDQVALFGILFYMLQIVDAHVDAHLIEFDVNQDLSVKLEPSYQRINHMDTNLGLSLKFKF
jgi:hypothetical protein